MKINKLTLQNINAIKGRWTLDFEVDAFYQAGIFAILGATGSGKTTLLDAICLAIYGATPRLNKISKSENALMSIGTSECQAIVELTINDKRYRFDFVQRRARNKPDGALQDPTHEISEWQGNKFALISEKKSHSEKLAQEILGMDFTQFTRSVMLAQGSFSAFLQSKPEERGEILEKITGTDIYAKIGEKVFATHSQKHKQLIAKQEKLGDMIILSDDEFLQLETQLSDSNAKKQQFDKQIEQITHQLTAKTEYEKLNINQQDYKQQLIKINQEIQDFLPNLTKLNNGKNHNAIRPFFDYLNETKSRKNTIDNTITELTKKHDDFLKQQTQIQQELTTKNQEFFYYDRLKEMSSHSPLSELSLTHQNHLNELKNAIELLKNKQTKILSIREKKEQVKNNKDNLEIQLENDKKTHQEECRTLIQNLDKYNYFSTNLTDITVARTVLEQIGKQERAMQTDGVRLATFGEKFGQFLEKNNKINVLEQELLALGTQLEQSKNALAQHQYQKETSHALLKEAEQSYQLSNEINRLSDFVHTLVDGTPCPLCGSQDHPYAHTPPDRQSEHQALYGKLLARQQDLDIASQTLDNTKSQVNELNAKYAQEQRLFAQSQSEQQQFYLNLQNEWQILEASIKTQTPNIHIVDFASLNNEYLSNLLTQIHHQQQILSDVLKQYTPLLSNLEKQDQNIQLKQKELDFIAQSLVQLNQECKQEESEWKQIQHLPLTHHYQVIETKEQLNQFCQAYLQIFEKINNQSLNFELSSHYFYNDNIQIIYDDLKNGLPKLYEIGDNLGAVFESTKSQLNNLKNAEKLALKNYQQKNEHISQLSAHLSNINTQLSAILENIDTHQKTKQQTLIEIQQKEQEFTIQLQKHFDTLDEFLSAQLDLETINELENKNNALTDNKRQYELQLTNTQQALEQLLENHPNILDWQVDMLNNELSDLNTQKELLLTTLGAINTQYTQAKTNKAQADNLAKEIQEGQQIVSDWALLNRLIGSEKGKKYRNFAQSLTLTALLDEANVVLQKMNDRYILTTANDPKNLLSIELIDTHQGDVVRQSKNLSGGESFLVSLSLALGLSAMSSQNMQIDSLFLDEGFGTLDEEALDIALTALSEIQASGKMIGIISHIGALKERIGTQIVVQKKGEGASTLSGIGVTKEA